MIESTPRHLDLTRKVNYRILRAILTSKEPFAQIELSESTHAAPSQVNRLVRWLEVHEHVQRRKEDGRYEVRQPASLVLAIFPYQRVMSRALRGTVKVRGEMESVTRTLSDNGATLCLETALAQYSNYFRADRIAVYHPNPRSLLSGLVPSEGGLVLVTVYEVDIPLEGDQVEPDAKNPLRRTSQYRTLIDLVCDNRTYAAKDLFSELWGVRLG